MTDHRAEALRLIAESHEIIRPNDEGHCEADRLLAEAQVHATLALSAPTVETPKGDDLLVVLLDSIASFQQTARLASLQHAQMRRYLAEHLLNSLTAAGVSGY
jgi:hypothetical protein